MIKKKYYTIMLCILLFALICGNDRGVATCTTMDKEKVVYLTFDDGPSNNTLRILEILKENNIQGTFFVNAKSNYLDVYKKIYEDGHVIANHGYTHDYDKCYQSSECFLSQVLKLRDFLKELGIEDSGILRFPGGSNNTISEKYGGPNIMDKIIPIMVENNYSYYDWNVSSGDATSYLVDKDVIVNNVINQCCGVDNAMVLMHDAAHKVTTVEALPEIISYLKNEGFIFKVITPEDTPDIHFK